MSRKGKGKKNRRGRRHRGLVGQVLHALLG
jgi:hypothetical protein